MLGALDAQRGTGEGRVSKVKVTGHRSHFTANHKRFAFTVWSWWCHRCDYRDVLEVPDGMSWTVLPEDRIR